MENTSSVAIIKWMSGLNATNKLFVVMCFAILTLSTVCVTLHAQNNNLHRQVNQLQAESMASTKECEQRVSRQVIAQGHYCDSITRTDRVAFTKECEERVQQVYLGRTEVIKNRNSKIENALK